MRAWIGALVVGLSFGCSGSGAKSDGGAGSGGGAVGGRGGQAGGAAGQAGGAAGQAGGAAGQAGGASGTAGGGGSGGSAGGGAGGSAGGGGAAGSSGRGGASGSGGSGGASGSGGVAGSGVVVDGGFNGCQMIGALSFDSIDERECGLTPPDSGPSRCHWRISFTNGTTFTWRHSDYVESGSYTCSANTITAQTQTRGTLTVTLEPLWRFTWDGVIYVCNGCPP